MTKPLALFGNLVMKALRDEALQFFEGLVDYRLKAPALQSLQDKLDSFSPEQLNVIRGCVRASVDEGIHSFLFALHNACEEGILEITVNGKRITDLSDGLHGELFTEDGWQARFSQFGESSD